MRHPSQFASMGAERRRAIALRSCAVWRNDRTRCLASRSAPGRPRAAHARRLALVSGGRNDRAMTSPREPGTDAVADRVFVGRRRELAELRGGFDDAVAGRGRFFLVVGEPGIGKTRLVDELAREAIERGGLALWGRCWE